MAHSSAATGPPTAEAPRRPGRRPGGVLTLAAATLAAHVAVNLWGPYELHRDALLYLAMGEHLRLFAMDFPPFIAIVAEATRGLLGDSVAAIRLGPALSHAALVFVGAAFARLAGGRAGSQLLTAVVVATAPVFLRAGSLFQPVVFDQLWWTLALYALARVGLASDPDTPEAPVPARHWWLALGLFLGLGLLTKFTILVLGAAILIGILASPLRAWLATPWPWLAAALALVVGSPGLVGQVVLGWPFFGQFDDLQSIQLARRSATGFVLEQLLLVGPIVLVGVAGATTLIVRREHRPLRPVGWSAVAAFVLMLIAGGKSYYIAPIWPALLGAGLAAAERWTDRLRRSQPLTAGGVGALVLAAVLGFGVVSLPMGLPFLPPAPMARYAAALGLTTAVTTNTGEVLELPQDYADMLGWEAMADAVTRVWRSLPPSDRERAVVLATNYGRAGAVDFYGAEELPPAIAPVGSYWFWGPGPPATVAVVVGAEREEALRYFRSAVEVERLARPWGVSEERDVPIVVARDPIRPLADVWSEWEGVN